MLNLIALLIIVGIILAAVPVENTMRRLVIGLVCVGVVWWLFGFFGHGHSLSLR